MENSGFKKIEESPDNYKIVGNIDGKDIEFIPLLKYQSLLEQAEKMAEVLEHSIELEHYTPGGSTENWAKEILQSWQEFKK